MEFTSDQLTATDIEAKRLKREMIGAKVQAWLAGDDDAFDSHVVGETSAKNEWPHVAAVASIASKLDDVVDAHQEMRSGLAHLVAILNKNAK